MPATPPGDYQCSRRGHPRPLIGLRVLLPGHSTLWRLVASARERADERGYAMLTEPVIDGQRDRLLELLSTPAGRRLSTLERLRRPIVDPSIKG